MTKVEQIEKAVAELSDEELTTFRRWFRSFDADLWDRQIDEDAAAGRLDAMADRALADFRVGRARPL